MERFVGPYQVKGIISTNAIELDLLSTVKIHSVINVSRVHRYKDQVKGQKKGTTGPSHNRGRRRIQSRKNTE